MPKFKSSEKMNTEEYQRISVNNQEITPILIPEQTPATTRIIPHHCSLPFCVICDPEKFQVWFKKTFGVEYKPK